METVLSALISAGAAIIVCVLTQSAQAKKTAAMMEYRLDELTKRAEKHNSVIDRTYQLEEKMAITEEKIKVANHRISDLERREK